MNTNTRALTRIALTAVIALMMASGAFAQFSLTTTFAGGNGQSGNMFDVSPAAGGVIINSFDINLQSSGTVEIYAVTGGGSYVGNEANSAAWTMLASLSVTSLGSGIATPLNLSLGYVVAPGTTQGFYITGTTTSVSYTNGSAAGALYASDANLNFYEGIGVAYPFSSTFSPRIWNGTIHYGLLSTVADDIALTAVTSPVGQSFTCTPLSATETVTIDLRNYGMNPVPAGTTLLLNYQVDNQIPVTEALLLPSAMTVGALQTYSFLAPADFSVPGPHTLSVSATYVADLDPTNDTRVVTVDSGAAYLVNYPYVEDLDGLNLGTTLAPPGWGQDPTDATGSYSDWEFRDNATPNGNTGPNGDLSGSGIFAYVDDRGEFSAVNLRTPCFDLSALAVPRLGFYLHSFNNSIPGTDDATLSIDVISQSTGMTTTDALGPLGHQGANWTYHTLDLSAWAADTVQIVFRVSNFNGQSKHDIAIDDVAVFEIVPTPGQSPQVGLAVMDINKARNANQQGTYVASTGPYYGHTNSGETLAFSFQGEPNRAIVLLAGPLNPVAATFANVGQFDIGGPINGSTGLPTQITVLADGGNAMGLNAFFVTGPTGQCDLGFGVPTLPANVVLTTFQAAMFTSGVNGAPIALSNAIEVRVN
ncbi:MAG: hypothetical protein H6807_03180 [Planctomycetes bacterium]|nr:hypothetical protein [Planctomycetota bacterium]